MSDIEIKTATPTEISRAIKKLRDNDPAGMLKCVLELPSQILEALERALDLRAGDAPRDPNRVHLIGLGGSAIAGDMVNDMLYPRDLVSIHRATEPLRDRSGIVVSSYSGNTYEIVELAKKVSGGHRSVVFMTSGGKLAQMGKALSVPVWEMPTGYMPRAALGYGMAYMMAVMAKWRVAMDGLSKLSTAAKRLQGSLAQGSPEQHPLVRAALPIAKSIVSRSTLVFHTQSCTGAARRFAAQINENSKQQAFPMLMPEAMHNAVEGLGGADPQLWTLVFMSDPSDAGMIRDATAVTMKFYLSKGFFCVPFPSSGNDAVEHTLSRLLLGDFISVFVAAIKDVDPSPVPTITELKQLGAAQQRR